MADFFWMAISVFLMGCLIITTGFLFVMLWWLKWLDENKKDDQE